jgi:hypothetical protein
MPPPNYTPGTSSISRRTAPKQITEETEMLPVEHKVDTPPRSDDPKGPCKRTKHYHFYWFMSLIMTIATVLMPIIFYVIAQEQLFSKFTPSLTDWASALSLAVFINVVALVSTVMLVTNKGFNCDCSSGDCRGLNDTEQLEKRKRYELIVRYLLTGLLIGGTLLGSLHNIYNYAKQGVDALPGQNLDNTFINIEYLRTTGAVSYLENHICRFLNNLQNMLYWSVFFSSHLVVAHFILRKPKGE